MARFRAQPYAKALYGVVRDEHPGRADEVGDELATVAAALAEVPELERVLTTPLVAADRKRVILDEVLDALGVTEPARRFVHVVQQHYRMQHMADIVAVYREVLDRALGRVRAHVETAGAVDGDDRERIMATLSEVLDAEVVAEFVKVPELLAGFRARVGSKVFDGSLAAQVNRLSRETALE